MNREQKFRYEMFVRAAKFGAANRELFPESSMGGRWFAAVSAAVAAIEQYLTRRVVARAEAQKVKASTKAAVYEYMKAIASTARRVMVQEPSFNPFRIPKRRSAPAILSTARAFIDEATQRQDAFIVRGLPPTFVADFRALVDQLDQAVHVRLTSKTDRHEATAGIEKALEQGFEAIKELDVFVPNTLRLDPVRLAAWHGARRIEGSSSSSTPREATPVPASAPTPTIDEPVNAPSAAPMDVVEKAS